MWRTKAHVRFDTEDTESFLGSSPIWIVKLYFIFISLYIFRGRRWLRLFPLPVNIWDNNETDETNCLETSRSASKSAECSGYCIHWLSFFYDLLICSIYSVGLLDPQCFLETKWISPGGGYYRVSQIEKNSNKWLSSGTTTTTPSPPGQPPTLIMTPSTATREISASTARRGMTRLW